MPAETAPPQCFSSWPSLSYSPGSACLCSIPLARPSIPVAGPSCSRACVSSQSPVSLLLLFLDVLELGSVPFSAGPSCRRPSLPLPTLPHSASPSFPASNMHSHYFPSPTGGKNRVWVFQQCVARQQAQGLLVVSFIWWKNNWEWVSEVSAPFLAVWWSSPGSSKDKERPWAR